MRPTVLQVAKGYLLGAKGYLLGRKDVRGP